MSFEFDTDGRLLVRSSQGQVSIEGTVTTSPTLNKTIKRNVSAVAATRTLVNAVAGKRIRVTAWEAQNTANADLVTFQWRGASANGPPLGILWSLASREGAMASPVAPPAFLFETSASADLVVAMAGSGVVNVAVSYFDDD